MKKRKISLLFIFGVLMILCSLCIMLVFRFRMNTGYRECQRALSQINELLPDKTQGTPGLYQNANMPVIEINGVDYCGILEIPELGITLPVADNWDNRNLYAAPSRFWGSVYDDILIIGGSDNQHQVDFCDTIEDGTLIIVTDMTGTQFSYTVSGVDRAKDAEFQWLNDADCDLVLFCRDTYSFEYIAVRCVSAY